MSSVSKGDQFEAEIFALLQEEVLSDRFVFPKDRCRLYQKKPYFSRDRKADIVFDVVIEAFVPGHETPSIRVVVECKNYGHAVPVSDIEEFYAKLQQIGGANTKGVVATRGAFQRGAIEFARSKGIGILRYYSSESFKWVLTRPPSAISCKRHGEDASHVHQVLLDEQAHSRNFDVHAAFGSLSTNSLNRFVRALAYDALPQREELRKILNGKTPRRPLVPFLDAEHIQEQADRVLDEIGYSTGRTDLEGLCKLAEQKAGLIVVNSGEAPPALEDALASISFDPLQITLYCREQQTEERQRFTLAHELGHYFLGHDRYLKREVFQQKDLDAESPEPRFSDIQRLEWQANHFASCLLLPARALCPAYATALRRLNVPTRGRALYVDNQPCNQKSYYAVTDALKRRFGVSREALSQRLQLLGLLQDDRPRLKQLVMGQRF